MEQPMVHHHQWVPLPRSAVAPVLWHGPSKVWKGAKKKVDVNSSGNQGAFSCFFLDVCVCTSSGKQLLYICIYATQNIVYKVTGQVIYPVPWESLYIRPGNPRGRGIAVRQFSPLRRREALPTLPPTLQTYRNLQCFVAFPCFRSCRLRWVNMAQHKP